jgi:5S rRNA maturation endonuclease (ribonuclease M5)
LAAEEFDSLMELIEKLRKESGPILVEGKKDEASLRKLGIEVSIIPFRALKSGIETMVKSLGDRVILMTDFDRGGLKLSKMVESLLRPFGVKVDMYYWRKIRALTKGKLKDVEGLSSYMESLRIAAGRAAGRF